MGKKRKERKNIKSSTVTSNSAVGSTPNERKDRHAMVTLGGLSACVKVLVMNILMADYGDPSGTSDVLKTKAILSVAQLLPV